MLDRSAVQSREVTKMEGGALRRLTNVGRSSHLHRLAELVPPFAGRRRRILRGHVLECGSALPLGIQCGGGENPRGCRSTEVI
jgi:hypothetical protein